MEMAQNSVYLKLFCRNPTYLTEKKYFFFNFSEAYNEICHFKVHQSKNEQSSKFD